MITMRVQGLDELKRLPKAIQKEVRLSARRGAKNYAKWAGQQIRAGLDPDGIPQKRSKSKVPLVDTGLLSTGSRWRVSSTIKRLVLYPPKDREVAVVLLMRKGYRLILNTPTQQMVDFVVEALAGGIRQWWKNVYKRQGETAARATRRLRGESRI